ncbi:hypothetical protein WN944_026633 [Citrus x changshan-huyou]|uniref:Uncharacterized protein n=1 Tax=Citrus x changshan-huyou TaxID=2935761 RepID=A0AAP0LSD0_9ROSI
MSEAASPRKNNERPQQNFINPTIKSKDEDKLGLEDNDEIDAVFHVSGEGGDHKA